MQRDGDQSRIILDILESVDRDGVRPQRSRASEVGIALGLVNAYLKFCIHKGYLRALKISPRTYQYMLTPTGFAEKSRLALSRLSTALEFVHASRGDYAALFAQAQERGWRTVVIVTASQLAEICTICALEYDIRIVAIVDAEAGQPRMLGVPVHASFEAISEEFDGAVIADLADPGKARDDVIALLGADRVMTPRFLNIAPHAVPEAAQ
jgi:predicted transcriptional regulator